MVKSNRCSWEAVEVLEALAPWVIHQTPEIWSIANYQ